jgi:hypothetical protein
MSIIGWIDHIGFDVKDQAAFVQKDSGGRHQARRTAASGAHWQQDYLHPDPWGTRIEIIERARSERR